MGWIHLLVDNIVIKENFEDVRNCRGAAWLSPIWNVAKVGRRFRVTTDQALSLLSSCHVRCSIVYMLETSEFDTILQFQTVQSH